MARIERITKSRKEQRCSKCGKIIPKGSSYLKASPYSGPVIVRCMECGLRPYETSGSYYIQTAGALVENWQNDYPIDDGIVDSLKDAVQELYDQCEESFDNIPESLQYAPAGELLQERMDNLDDVMNELDGIDYDTILEEEIDEYMTSNEDEFIEKFGEDFVDSFSGELSSLPEEDQENILESVKDELISQIDEALCQIDY